MEVSRIGRAVFALNVVVVVVGVVISVAKAGESDEAFFTGAAARLNVFSYFTIQSNLILALTCLLLAVGMASSATWFRVLRLIGVVGIALTFVVFQAVLRDLQDLTGLNALSDFLLHTLSPILGVGGWLLFGPRRLTSVTVVWWTTAYVAAYGLFSMIRGAIIENDVGTHFYPYGFMNAVDHGYPRAILNMAMVAVVFFALAFGAHALDGWLARRRAPATHR